MSDSSDSSEVFERPCDGPQPCVTQAEAVDDSSDDSSTDELVLGNDDRTTFSVNPVFSPSPPPVKEVAVAGSKKAGAIRWPHLKSLLRNYTKDVKTLLDQVTECECVNQPLASNANPKGNKWARLHLVMYGGDSNNTRGAFSFSELPKIPDACKLKKKVAEIWKYVTTLSPEDEGLFDSDIVKSCKQQLSAYDENCKRVNDTTDADRKMEALRTQMTAYERQQGALPPGAKGTQGAGRIEHSTNTRLGQPATYAWRNAASSDRPPARAASVTSSTNTVYLNNEPASCTRDPNDRNHRQILYQIDVCE